MKSFFNALRIKASNLSVAARAIGFVIVLLCIGSTIWWLRSDQQQLAIAGIIIALILLLTAPIWQPDSSTPGFFRVAVLFVVEMAALAYSIWQPVVNEWIKDFVAAGKMPAILQSSPISQYPTVVFALLILTSWLIGKLLPDRSVMGRNRKKDGSEFMKVDFWKNRDKVCIALKAALEKMDEDTQWNVDDFVPLDAEVEIKSGSGKRKKIMDLLKAIRVAAPEMIVILGEPGSGKSVALRKLCVELFKEVKVTNKIPIYINLKEWQVEKKWDEEHPPTVRQLNDFVLNKLMTVNPRVSRFFQQYYELLYDNDMLFFVMDSFDEIPAVLDEKDKSPLIRALSDIIVNFLEGHRASETKSILASRVFRQPVTENVVRTTLEIRPFTERKIRQALDVDKELINTIFHKRSDLIPVVRNPLMARLLSLYIRNHENRLPANQSELFSSFIEVTLNNCSHRMQQFHLTNEEVIDTTIDIAHVIFSDHGLEGAIDEICRRLPHRRVMEVINILKFSRIGRTGAGDENLFSFSHRRFCEYFAIQKRIRDKAPVELEAIPTDSQWRDALVLYCEVADEQAAKKIAAFCWQEIKGIDNPGDKRSIHCMRFLRDAFKSRPECMEDFRDELGDYIVTQVESGRNMIIIKLAIECIGLVDESKMKAGIVKALESNNEWIQESALKSCRHLSSISPELEMSLQRYICRYNFAFFLLRYRDLKFSFSLSEAFSKVLRCIRIKFIESLSIVLMNLVVAAFFPLGYSILLGFMTLISFVEAYRKLFLQFTTSNETKYQPDEVWPIFFKLIRYLPVATIAILLIPMVIELKFEYPLQTSALLISSLCIAINIPMNNLDGWEDYNRGSLAGIAGGGIGLAVIGGIFYLGDKLLPEIVGTILGIGWICLLALYGVVFILYTLYTFFSVRSVYKAIDFTALHNREAIYASFFELGKFHYWQSRLISYLEVNVKNATGDWPDPDFLNLTSDKNITRLAKLEAKWLGTD